MPKFTWLFVIALFSLNSVSILAQDSGLNLPTAGFDTNSYHPLFIQSKDGQFKLNIGLYSQVRYNMNWRASLPDSIENFTRGYNLARTRIFLEGDITDKMYYHFRMNINPSGNFELMVAYLQFNINKKWNLRVGKQFMALGREDWMYPENLASMEFSAHDFTFAIWTSFGLQVRNTPNDNMRYWLGISNGAYGARKSFPQPTDSDVLLTGRFEWNVQGVNWDDWDDMLGRKGRDFGILVGFGAGQLYRSDKTAIKTEASSASQFNLDLTVSGDGFQFFAQGSVTNLHYEPGVEADYFPFGAYATMGYWVGDKWFPYARFDMVSAGNKSGTWEDYVSPGIGFSYYPFSWTNRIRLTAEYNFLGSTLNKTIVTPDGQLGLVESSYGSQQSVRFQLQFGF
jgi:hypothetical protein